MPDSTACAVRGRPAAPDRGDGPAVAAGAGASINGDAEATSMSAFRADGGPSWEQLRVSKTQAGERRAQRTARVANDASWPPRKQHGASVVRRLNGDMPRGALRTSCNNGACGRQKQRLRHTQRAACLSQASTQQSERHAEGCRQGACPQGR